MPLLPTAKGQDLPLRQLAASFCAWLLSFCDPNTAWLCLTNVRLYCKKQPQEERVEAELLVAPEMKTVKHGHDFEVPSSSFVLDSMALPCSLNAEAP